MGCGTTHTPVMTPLKVETPFYLVQYNRFAHDHVQTYIHARSARKLYPIPMHFTITSFISLSQGHPNV